MAQGSIERIQVILQAVTTKFSKGLARAQTQLKSVGNGMQDLGNSLSMSMEKFKLINQVVGMSIQRFKKFSKGLSPNVLQEFNLRMRKSGTFVDTHTKRVISATHAQKRMTNQVKSMGGRVGNTFRMLTHGMRGFRMEALGVMFFGMMMQKMFMGLLQPVMEAFGVFDLFRIMLMTLFLPTMKTIFPFLLKLMEWFRALSPSVKQAIGIFVILGAIFGTIIMVLGQFALGIGSLIQFFPILGVVIKAVGAFLMGLSGIALAVIAAIVIVFIGMFVAWKENFMGMKTIVSNIWEAIKGIFGSAINILKAIIKFWVAIFKGDFEGAKDAVIIIFKNLYIFFQNFKKLLLNLFIAVGIGIVRVFMGVVDTIKNLIVGLISWVWGKIKGLGSSIISSVTGKFGGGGGGRRMNDFIWRPGQSPIDINPNDTLVGFKGSSPNLGGGGEITQTNNFYGFTMEDLKSELDDRDRRLVNQIERNI